MNNLLRSGILPLEIGQPSVVDQLMSNLPQQKGEPSLIDQSVFKLVGFVLRFPFLSGSGSVF
jgi:hypothetical protein